MKKFTILFVICMFLFMNQIKAQVWTTYDTLDGLANNIINAIAIDAQGNKWFGTNGGGVSKFDDTTWTTYDTSDGLASNAINAIAIDAEGNKWFGTSGGVSKFDGVNWTTYTTADGLGLGSNMILAIAIDTEGNKWFATEGHCDSRGISKFDDTTWTTYDPRTYAIAIDGNNDIWVGYKCWPGGCGGDWIISGCKDLGVLKFDGTNWTSYTTEDGLVDYSVKAIAIDSEGNKWFGCGGYNYWNNYYGGVSKFNDTTWTTYTIADGLVSNNIQAIAIDADGNKWFGTSNGVSKLSEDDGLTGISVSPINQNVGFETGSATYSIISDANWAVSYDSDWLTVSPNSGNGNATITANFEANDSTFSRVAHITISKTGSNSKSIITVTQEGVKILDVSPSIHYVSYEVGDTAFYISSNTNWTISDDGDWLTVNPTSGNGNDTITVNFEANTLTSPRIATIIVSGEGAISDTIIVTQDGYVSIPSIYDSKTTIYPNPVSDIAKFDIENSNSQEVYLEIFDFSGRLIGEKISTAEKIDFDFSNYSAGIYFYRVRNSERIIGAGKIVRD